MKIVGCHKRKTYDPEFTPVFSGVRVVRSLVLCIVFCRSLFVSVVFLLPLYCLPFFDLQIPFTTLTTFLMLIF